MAGSSRILRRLGDTDDVTSAARPLALTPTVNTDARAAARRGFRQLARWGQVVALALLVSSSGPSLAHPGVAPSRRGLAVARPADDVPHPGARTEWWYVHAIEPGSGRTVIAVFFTAPIAAAAGFLYTPTRITHWTQLSLRRPQTGPGVHLSTGGIHYDPLTQRWLITEQAGGYRLQLRLSTTRPGITIGPHRVGDQQGSWTVPVATGRADGAITTPTGNRISIRNWRAYHDHNWGSFDLQSHAYQGWEWAAIHEQPGHAWLLGGINTLDGNFTGVLVYITPTNTSSCRPTLTRQDWKTFDGLRLPLTITATCGRTHIAFHVLRPYVVTIGNRALSESIGRTTTPNSIGLIEHYAPHQR